MKKKNLLINEIVEYGLSSIKSDETIEVNLRDLLYIYKTVEEFNRFFHQPNNYMEIDNVSKYIGDKDYGAFSLIHNIYYNIFDRMLPQNIKDIIEDDDFKHPGFPDYYKK